MCVRACVSCAPSGKCFLGLGFCLFFLLFILVQYLEWPLGKMLSVATFSVWYPSVAETHNDEASWSHLHPLSRFPTLLFVLSWCNSFKASLVWNNVLFVSASSVSSLLLLRSLPNLKSLNEIKRALRLFSPPRSPAIKAGAEAAWFWICVWKFPRILAVCGEHPPPAPVEPLH